MTVKKVEKPVNVEKDLEKVKAGAIAQGEKNGKEEARSEVVNSLISILNATESSGHAMARVVYNLVAPPREYSSEERAKLQEFDDALADIDTRLSDKTLSPLLRKPAEKTRATLVRNKANYEAQLRHVESSEIDNVVGKWLEDNNVSAYVQNGALFRKGNAEAKMGKEIISDKGVDTPDAFDMAIEKYSMSKVGHLQELKSLLELSSAHILQVGQWTVMRIGSKAYCAVKLTKLDGQWDNDMFMTYSRDGLNQTPLFPRWSLIRPLLLEDGYADGMYHTFGANLRTDIARALWKLFRIDIVR